jgi:hypothetical protein
MAGRGPGFPAAYRITAIERGDDRKEDKIDAMRMAVDPKEGKDLVSSTGTFIKVLDTPFLRERPPGALTPQASASQRMLSVRNHFCGRALSQRD